ncbi:MAG: Gfo/Idh/MocA family protein [Spirochaetota bacterium]
MSEDEKTYGLADRQELDAVSAPDLPYQPEDVGDYRPAIGLIGCGGISQQHLTAYKQAGYRVTALCNPHIEKAEKARDAYYPDADVYSRYQDLLARDDIEVVDCTTHPEVRLQIMKDAIDAGKHVLSQKPFVIDIDEGLKLCDRADKRGVKLAVNQNGRWAPHFSYMRKVAEAGYIGDIGAVHMAISWDHSWIAGTPFEDIHDLILYDFGIHWFDMLAVFMKGKQPKQVYAATERFPGQKVKPPFLAEVIVEYEDALGSITLDANTHYGAEDRTVVVGSSGTMRSFGPDLNDQQVVLYTKEGMAMPKLSGRWFPDGFHGAMAELLHAIKEGREPEHNARENLKSLELCFAAVASSARGKPITPGKIKKYEA